MARGRWSSWAPLGALIVLALTVAIWSASSAPRGAARRLSSPPNSPATSVTSPGPPPATTTSVPSLPATTGTLPPPCQTSQFAVRLRTGKTAYVTGEPVDIAMTISNRGPTCTGTESSPPCGAGVAISNESGQLVWLSNPGPVACPALIIEAVPSAWSESSHLTWTQDRCPAIGSQCTHAQVPPGVYALVGKWWVAESASQSPPWTLTITAR